MRRETITELASYVEAFHPIIYIEHFDFKIVDMMLREVGGNIHYVEYNNALGAVDFQSKRPLKECDLVTFLKDNMDDGFDEETFIVLKEIDEELRKPAVVALLKRISDNNLYRDDYRTTIFIISEEVIIPKALENYITLFEIPVPTLKEIACIIVDFAKEMETKIDPEVVDELALSFLGLNEFQIHQILNLAYQDGGCLDKDDKRLILREKEQFLKKSGMLELVRFSDKMDDIGGLENLKEWLQCKEKIFSNMDKALKFGVDVPKGIMIIGMPGCGKSLTAKATAGLFKIPLVRLDVGRLLGKYVGESEGNMRKALHLAEAISPCVLWVDEIEKAFSGVGKNGGSDVTTRLFGQFLTWLQEKENTVFIVATANDISQMPPEFLRKGRFDELFFVDLPNADERRKIIEIHLKKRKKWNSEFENNFSKEIIENTEGFNGADLEAAVKGASEKAFINNKKEITVGNLLEEISNTNSISKTMKDKIDEIARTIQKMDIKRASKEKKA